MQTASDLISSIYKSRNVITTLMEKQGYNVEEYEHFSISDVNLMYQNKQLDMLIEKKEIDNIFGIILFKIRVLIVGKQTL
jgi:hypothetical protein